VGGDGVLSKQDNEIVCRVGPGTQMGNLMREYWLPALLSSELPHPDSDPVRVMLLGERLIAFRDTHGQVGLLASNCPHRGASLFFGRNEESGLRCVYHGWKFDSSGVCVDMPNEPAESDFRTKVKAVAYPCHERGGIVWTYMGPRPEPPELPDLEPNNLGEKSIASAVQRDCNYLQALEGDIDTSHFSFLHFGHAQAETAKPGTFQYFQLKHRAPKYSVLDTDYGVTYGAYRPADNGRLYWRIAHFLFPCFTMIPTGVLGDQILVRGWVPMDDTHTMFYSMQLRPEVASQFATETQLNRSRNAVYTPMLPDTSDWYGRFRLEARAGNDYRIDRQAQRSKKDFTGIAGIHTQDQAITESMGTIYNRTTEHLGTSDAMVIRVRRRLLDAARALAETRTLPISVDHPEVYRQRSGGVILAEDADWIKSTEELRKAYVAHPELDLTLAAF
jgi:phenylpropionate dioxygenase-like ring-hydroxylating dioxygenase large terminal subunit